MFSFERDSLVEAYCFRLAQEISRRFGIAQEESIEKINEYWSGEVVSVEDMSLYNDLIDCLATAVFTRPELPRGFVGFPRLNQYAKLITSEISKQSGMSAEMATDFFDQRWSNLRSIEERTVLFSATPMYWAETWLRPQLPPLSLGQDAGADAYLRLVVDQVIKLFSVSEADAVQAVTHWWKNGPRMEDETLRAGSPRYWARMAMLPSPAAFVFECDERSQAYCYMIVEEMERLLSISEQEAFERVNEQWRGVSHVGDSMLYHCTAADWACTIYFDSATPWWREGVALRAKPRPGAASCSG